MTCLRNGCGHGPGQHEATGPCLAPLCRCPGYKATLTAADEARELTRCSSCGRRPRSEGAYWGNHAGACSRHGKPPNAPEKASGR